MAAKFIAPEAKKIEEDRFVAALDHCVSALEGVLRLPPGVQFSWNRRFTSRAADASSWTGMQKRCIPEIRVGERMIHHFTEDARWRTYVHELAHVFAGWHHQANCGHDYRWREIMHICETTADVYWHDSDLLDLRAFYSPGGPGHKRGHWVCDCGTRMKLSKEQRQLVREHQIDIRCWVCKKVHTSEALSSIL